MDEGERARGPTAARIRWAAAWLAILGTCVHAVVLWFKGSRRPTDFSELGDIVRALEVTALASLLVVLVWVLVLARRRARGRPTLERRLEPPRVTDSTYLEAFALGLAFASFAPALVMWFGEPAPWWKSIIRLSAPLWAVAWLHLRRVPVSTMRVDSGLYRGAGVWAEARVALIGLAAAALIQASWLLVLYHEATAHARPTFLEQLYIYQAVYGVLYAPLIEEFLFRGLLYRHLRTRSGFWASALISTALFTLMHTDHDLYQLVGVAALGLLSAALREWRGSLLAPIIAHAGLNAAVLIPPLI